VHPLEKHWQRITLVSIALLPLTALFALVSSLRRCAYAAGFLRKVRVAAPVVVVGNLSVGGTGKTPVVIWLVNALRAHGYTPGVISRGYRGNEQLQGIDAQSSADVAGDEPVLIARHTRCPVWVGRDRAAAAASLLDANPQVNVLISDDGLQHYRLARDCELVVINANRQFGNRLLLPSGPLREPVKRLHTVDAAIINGRARASDELSRLPTQLFEMRLEGTAFCNLVDESRRASPGDFAAKRVHAVAGIGDPDRFFAHLRALGLSFEPHAFPDHYVFRSRDLEFDDADAVLMTEKDAIKCVRFARENWWSLPVQARIDEALVNLVIRKIGSAIRH
jgi:tetraacyldisaccharide 4'-kinase